MRQELFRREAIEAQRDRAIGSVIHLHAPGVALLSWLAFAAALALIAFATWGEYTRKAHVSGFLSPSKGLVKVHTPASGTIVDKRVHEGQHVAQGEVLYVLSTEQGSEETASAQQRAIDQLVRRRASLEGELTKKAGIDRIEFRSAQDRLSGGEAELSQLAAEMDLQRRRVASAELTLSRYRTLVDSHFVAPAQMQQKEDELLEQQARLQNLERTRLGLERDVGQLRQHLAAMALEAENGRSALGREITTLDQELTERRSRRTIVITAPAEGTVSAVLADRGQIATPQMPLLTLLPAGAVLQALLLVPSRSIGFVAPDQRVALRYQAFPYQRFGHQGGRVVEVSKTLISPGEVALPVALQESVYRVTVVLDNQSVRTYGHDTALQPGMLLEAEVMLDRRRIVEWLLDPLFSVARRV